MAGSGGGDESGGPRKKSWRPEGRQRFSNPRVGPCYFFFFAAFFRRFAAFFFLAGFRFLAAFFFFAAFRFFGAAFRAGRFRAPAAFLVADFRAFFLFFGAAFFFFADFFFLVATGMPPSAEGATKFSECDRIYVAV